MPAISEAYVIKQYVQKDRSTHDLARELHTYPNKIARILKKHGYELRDKEAAQKKALASGRSTHPTAGLERSPNVKKKISKGVSEAWKNLTEEEKAARGETARQQWEKMDDDKMEELRKAAAEGIRRAAKEGSKLEKYLLTQLRSRGFSVDFHKDHFISAEQQHLDLYLPDLKTAIEVDGPTHFQDIYGDGKLAKVQAADAKKNGLIINEGFIMIRVQCKFKNLSLYIKKEVASRLVKVLREIELENPITPRIIELEFTQNGTT